MEARSEHRILRFGPFELDPGRHRLSRGLDPVRLPPRHLQILLLLAARAGHVVTKEALIEHAWQGQAVSDDSLTQAVKLLRRTLGAQSDGSPFIETEARLGYRFAANVEHAAPAATNGAVKPIAPDASLHAYRAFVEGRAALETLDRDGIDRAIARFSTALDLKKDSLPAHIGLANAQFLAYESTRADVAPNRASLLLAEHHAAEACRLDRTSADAWGTLAVVLYRKGAWTGGDDFWPAGTPVDNIAVAAARMAVELEPGAWRHHVRLAFVSWGDQRLRAATRALSLCPGLALAHRFAASVFLARGAFDVALTHLRTGCALQDAHSPAERDTPQLSTVGLHLLHGLVLAAMNHPGSTEFALEELRRELGQGDPRHVYARECHANTWYAIGALHLRENREGARPEKLDAASAAFKNAIALVPGHALATLGLAVVTGTNNDAAIENAVALHDSDWPGDGQADPPTDVERVDLATARAVALALRGRHAEAARVCSDALAHADRGAAGWLLCLDPLLNVSQHRDVWSRVLSLLAQRAI